MRGETRTTEDFSDSSRKESRVSAVTAHTATYGMPRLLHRAKMVGAWPVMASAYRLRDAANMKL